MGDKSFELPDPLPESLDEILDLRGKAAAEFDQYKAKADDENSDFTAADIEAMKGLRDAIKKADSMAGEIVARRDAAKALVAELDEAEAEAGTEPEAELEPEAEPEAAKAPESAETPVAESEPESEAALVTAAVKPKPPKFTGRGGEAPTTPPQEKTQGWRIRTDAPGYNSTKHSGFQSLKAVKEALGDATMTGGEIGAPNGGTGTTFSKQVIASYHRDVTHVSDYETLDAALAKARSDATQHDMVYAAGWCAPSETLYDFCDVPPAVDLFTLPEVSAPRGGLRWPNDPSYNGPFQIFCEPELATAVKECVTIPCPDFTEVRLCAVPLCIEADILQNAAWPELTAYYVDLVTQTQRRQRAGWLLNEVLTHPDMDSLTVPPAGQLGAAASVLNSLTIGANRIRYGRSLGSSTVVDGVAPYWLKDVIRADIANQGGVPQYAVSDADIQRWLSLRGLAIQFIGHWQTLGDTTDEYPPTAQVVLFERGAFFALTKDVISLGVQYPRELLQVNMFTRFFIEDGLAVGKRCGNALTLTIPTCASGEIGERGAVSCPATGAS